jgi:multidrug efflux system membrane fusion protein
MEAIDYVEIRPQVDGRIEEIKFKDGDLVEKDDVLIVIEPRPYEATYIEATAAFDAAKSQHDLASKELRRAQKLIKTEAISRRVLDERKNMARISENALNGAKALLERAQIDVDRAYVKAPISGRISRPEVTIGNLVQTVSAPVLTSIVSQEGIYADFEVDEMTYLSRMGQVQNTPEAMKGIPVEVVLNDGTVRKGKMQSFDNRISTSSGTIRARATFGNKDGRLLPGMFVTVRLGSAKDDVVIILSEKAIGTDQSRKFVYVVTPDNKAVYRQVHLGPSLDGRRIITSGLKPGDQVITQGIMRIMPGMAVIPQTGDAVAEDVAAEGGEER